MTKIAIIADTSQDFTFELGKRYGIEVIPYQVQLDDQHYLDQVDLDSRTFYQRIGQCDRLSTGTPSLQWVIDRLKQLEEAGYEQAIALTSSAKLTGMSQLYGVVQGDFDKLKLTIFDTQSIASGAGLLTLYAAKLRDQGKSVLEIVQALDQASQQLKIYAVFRTLKYLIKGGRFNKYVGMIGSFLNIHPLLTVKEGEVSMISRTRGRNKSFNALVQQIQNVAANHENYYLTIFGANNPREVDQLKTALHKEIDQAELYLETELTPVLGVHSGPEAVGVAILPLD